ncbi:nuclear RNA export factor 2 isoform X2 [Halyomorpha halys]|uniref:nuclear RNA export factor 2 isoform X2 n=1 Tax=Halyomorpha halys TaxID=286706 RepID=UPI0034D2008F
MAFEEENISETIGWSDVKTLQSLWNSSDFDTVFGSSHWTRITVIDGGTYDKDEVLKAVLFSVHPVEVFPCLYQIDGLDSFFLVRNCSLFIRKIALNNLQATDSSGQIKFQLTVTTYYLSTNLEPLNPQFQLREALKKRTKNDHKYVDRSIDLTNMSQDKFLKDIFFSLTVPQCIHSLMIMIKNRYTKSMAKPSTLILQHNNLSSIDHLDLKHVPFIKNVDLRYNNLTWEALQKMPAVRIEALWLDGNPLCSGITGSEYVSKVVAIIDQLKKLDGIDISQTFKTANNEKKIAAIKNYICDTSWSSFVDHFCHHYFGLMESPNRHQLGRMYHQGAMFSFSLYNSSDVESDWNRLSKYMTFSRNLLTLSDITKAYTSLIIGPEKIVKIINSFPVVQYDPFSFTIEVPIANKNMVMINTSGIFQELDSGLYSFNRTFILTPYRKNNGEWKISNDMMYLMIASQEQIESFTKVRAGLSEQFKLVLNPSTNDKDALIPAMCEMTKLTKDWSVRLLEDASWNLERALQAFIDELKANQIPMIAFSV